MANTFTSYMNKDVGTSAATVVTVGAATQTTIIGLCMANTSASPVTASAYVTRSSVDYYVIKNATVPVGGGLVPVGGDMKVVMVTGDELKIVSSAAASLDTIVSVLNIT